MRIAAVSLVAASVLAPAALAAPKQDWDDCTSSDADVSIAGCGRSIALGDESKANTAIAYMDRGIAHQNKGEHQGAIADFNRSLKLNPNDPAVYPSRGYSFAQTEEYDLAIDDYNQTIALKSG
jgi:Flp pilus assembly protein TadD